MNINCSVSSIERWRRFSTPTAVPLVGRLTWWNGNKQQKCAFLNSIAPELAYSMILKWHHSQGYMHLESEGNTSRYSLMEQKTHMHSHIGSIKHTMISLSWYCSKFKWCFFSTDLGLINNPASGCYVPSFARTKIQTSWKSCQGRNGVRLCTTHTRLSMRREPDVLIEF